MGVSDGAEDAGKVFNSLTGSHRGLPAAPHSPITQSPPPGTQERSGKPTKSAFGSPILKAGQLLIGGMRLTAGWGDPERGEAFGQGSARFTHAGETVASSYPSEEWQGSGSQAYATANRRQADYTKSMATLDRNVESLIEREAYQVAHHRDKLDDQSDFLGDLSYVTWAMALIPGVGKAMKAIVELSAVSAALSGCIYELYQLSQEASENGEELRELVDEYSALGRKAAPPDLGDAPGPPPASDGPAMPDRPDQPGPGGPTATQVPGSPPTP
ncbi:MAG: EspA/EspE family type VII secretion system effector, partial [Mycobacterium sp.]